VEGDGSFGIHRSRLSLEFDISQSNKDLFLMQEIKKYLNSFPGVVDGYYKNNIVTGLRENNFKNPEHKSVFKIYSGNQAFIRDLLIPFFNQMD
jgi:hypothetical protein